MDAISRSILDTYRAQAEDIVQDLMDARFDEKYDDESVYDEFRDRLGSIVLGDIARISPRIPEREPHTLFAKWLALNSIDVYYEYGVEDNGLMDFIREYRATHRPSRAVRPLPDYEAISHYDLRDNIPSAPGYAATHDYAEDDTSLTAFLLDEAKDHIRAAVARRGNENPYYAAIDAYLEYVLMTCSGCMARYHPVLEAAFRFGVDDLPTYVDIHDVGSFGVEVAEGIDAVGKRASGISDALDRRNSGSGTAKPKAKTSVRKAVAKPTVRKTVSKASKPKAETPAKKAASKPRSASKTSKPKSSAKKTTPKSKRVRR